MLEYLSYIHGSLSYHLSSENAKFLFRLASESGSGYVTERFSRTQYCIAAISNR